MKGWDRKSGGEIELLSCGSAENNSQFIQNHLFSHADTRTHAYTLWHMRNKDYLLNTIRCWYYRMFFFLIVLRQNSSNLSKMIYTTHGNNSRLSLDLENFGQILWRNWIFHTKASYRLSAKTVYTFVLFCFWISWFWNSIWDIFHQRFLCRTKKCQWPLICAHECSWCHHATIMSANGC